MSFRARRASERLFPVGPGSSASNTAVSDPCTASLSRSALQLEVSIFLTNTYS